MALVEGIGDEVLVCFLVLLLIAILTLAWFSTNVRPIWHSGSVWLVHLQTHPNRRVLQVVSLDERQLEQASTGGLVVENGLTIAASTEEHRATRTVNVESSALTTSADNNGEETVALADIAETATDDEISNNTSELSEEVNLSNEQTANENDSPDTTIKLKFLDDTQRLVGAWLSQTVGQFKKRHFTTEVNEGKTVRLIYQGQLLRDDGRSLESYGIRDNCVLHCHVGTSPYVQSNSPAASRQAGGAAAPPIFVNNVNAGNANNNNNFRRNFEPGQFIYLIFGFKFVCLWLAYYAYPQLFGSASVFSLVACTGLYLIFLYGGRRRAEPEIQQQHQQS